LLSAAEDASQVQDPPSEERLTADRHVLEVKGTRQQMKHACTPGLDSRRKTNPDMSPALYNALKEAFTSDANIDALLKIRAVSLAKRFNPGELKELAAFYSTPLGKRPAGEEASITVEGMRAGQEWGRKIGESVDKDRMHVQSVPPGRWR